MSRWKFTAKNQGYFRVYVSSLEISKHIKEREALENAVNAAEQFPAAEVYYLHDYLVIVQEGSVTEPPPDPDPPPEPEPPPGGAPAGPSNLSGIMV